MGHPTLKVRIVQNAQTDRDATGVLSLIPARCSAVWMWYAQPRLWTPPQLL